MARVETALTQYQTNNNGKLPTTGDFPASEDDTIFGSSDKNTCTTTACLFVKNYLNGVNASENEFSDPDGTYYGITIKDVNANTTITAPTTLDHTVYIYTHAACDGENVVRANNKRDYAIQYKLEGSGIYCKDNGGSAVKSSSGTSTTTDTTK